MPFLMESGRFESEALEYTQSSGNRIQWSATQNAGMKKAGEVITRLLSPMAVGAWQRRGFVPAGAAAP